MNDKQWKIKEYLPKLSGKILFVGVAKDPLGVNHYSEYHKLIKTPESFETLDLLSNDMTSIKSSKHHVCDFLEFKNEYKYDHISLHGLWGDKFIYRKKDRELSSKKLSKIIINSINKAHNMLNVGGTIEIGPNTNVVNEIYDYMINEKLYKSLFRINRGENNCGNCIFWGEKLNNNPFNYNKEHNLWESIKTIGLFKD
tara:strand:+ start:292 stop:885 length:594 start_codon:yes stop_codon:yes gene_type:complete